MEQLYKVPSSCLDDHQLKQEELKSVGEMSEVCSQIVLNWLYLARIGRPDILWSVNKLAKPVTTMDSGMWQKISKIDFLFSSHWPSTILSCGKHSWRPWRLKIILRWCLVFFLKLDVQENKLRFRAALQNLKLFLWVQDYVCMGYLLLNFGT